jgi:hypothetical protein
MGDNNVKRQAVIRASLQGPSPGAGVTYAPGKSLAGENGLLHGEMAVRALAARAELDAIKRAQRPNLTVGTAPLNLHRSPEYKARLEQEVGKQKKEQAEARLHHLVEILNMRYLDTSLPSLDFVDVCHATFYALHLSKKEILSAEQRMIYSGRHAYFLQYIDKKFSKGTKAQIQAYIDGESALMMSLNPIREETEFLHEVLSPFLHYLVKKHATLPRGGTRRLSRKQGETRKLLRFFRKKQRKSRR